MSGPVGDNTERSKERHLWRDEQTVPTTSSSSAAAAAATPARCGPPSSGKRVALIEKDKVGGTCLHRGCIPTKALLHAAEIADQARDGEAFGVRSTFDGIDMAGVNAYKDKVVDRLWKGLTGTVGQPQDRRRSRATAGWSRRPRSRWATACIEGSARGAGHRLGAAQPARPGTSTGSGVITSDHALRLDHVPRSVVILGGGVIGVEFASVWRSFGAEVTIVEMLPHLLPAEEESSSKLLERAFRRRGIGYKLGTRFEGVKDTGTGVTVTLEGGKTIDAELLLVAVGRGPVSAGLGYEEAGVAIERGFVLVDEYCRTNVPTISAVGDLIARPAAGARRVRRGHPGRRAAGRAERHARSTTTACRGSPTATRRSPRWASPRRMAAERGIETTEFTYDLAGNGKSRSCRPRARRRSSRPRGGPPPARCSACTWSAPGSAS